MAGLIVARVDLANLLYVAGALAAATVVSAVYVLRHRKPRSMESAIDAFSRELRALAPDGRTERTAGSWRADPDDRARQPAPEAGDGDAG